MLHADDSLTHRTNEQPHEAAQLTLFNLATQFLNSGTLLCEEGEVWKRGTFQTDCNNKRRTTKQGKEKHQQKLVTNTYQNNRQHSGQLNDDVTLFYANRPKNINCK